MEDKQMTGNQLNYTSAPRSYLNPKSDRPRKLAALAIGLVSILLIFAMLITPFYKSVYYDSDGDKHNSTVRAWDIFKTRNISPTKGSSSTGNLFTLEALILFIAISVLGTIGVALLFGLIKNYFNSDAKYYKSVQTIVFYSTFVNGLFYLSSIIFCAIKNAASTTSQYGFNSGLGFWFLVAVAIFFAFLTRNISFAEIAPKPGKIVLGARIELFCYATLISALAIIASLGDILRVSFDIDMEDIYYNGFKAITGKLEIAGGLQVLSFFVIAFLVLNVSFFLLSLTSLIGRSRSFYQLALAQVIGGAITTFLIGLFGKYFEIAKEINLDVLNRFISLQLDEYGFGGFIDISDFGLDYHVSSHSLWFFIASLGVLLLTLLRKPFTRGTKGELIIAMPQNDLVNAQPEEDKKEEEEENEKEKEQEKEKENHADTEEHMSEEPQTPLHKDDHDPCPAFTGIDRKYEALKSELEAVRASAFESITLPELVNFVVNYARDSRLHLYYTPEDIATFIAGLGTTRLTILQGMSGTGKTSLPKIFAEALQGVCNIVEVESSWRDKNELLGYYNEFSKVYTPKKFTLALYRARLFPERPTFIVLDEMNLSRIEYYFSDFLSLMEHEEHLREIKLLGTPLFRKFESKRYRYMGLTEGTTVKIPSNIWFIGTANRDESTFEISDKVYDRAHTMNFNKRAPKVRSTGEPIPRRYISSGELRRLFEEAKANIHFDIESSSIITEVEALLAPYNISFGNRIANQIESFVRIYAACFGGTERATLDGLERILLSKVVSKLEFKSVDNKEEIAAEFERIGLLRCRDFVLSLNED